jgi:transposase-like protein
MFSPTPSLTAPASGRTGQPILRLADVVEEDTPRPIRLCLLGQVRVESGGEPITTGLRRITRDLMAYLALHPAGITREQGVDALMPDRELQAGTTMFHTAISNARKTLREATGLREPYPPEFRRQMVELVRAGRTPEELAAEFEPTAQSIRNWVVQADRDEGRRQDGLASAEKDELARLRREPSGSRSVNWLYR